MKATKLYKKNPDRIHNYKNVHMWRPFVLSSFRASTWNRRCKYLWSYRWNWSGLGRNWFGLGGRLVDLKQKCTIHIVAPVEWHIRFRIRTIIAGVIDINGWFFLILQTHRCTPVPDETPHLLNGSRDNTNNIKSKRSRVVNILKLILSDNIAQYYFVMESFVFNIRDISFSPDNIRIINPKLRWPSTGNHLYSLDGSSSSRKQCNRFFISISGDNHHKIARCQFPFASFFDHTNSFAQSCE